MEIPYQSGDGTQHPVDSQLQVSSATFNHLRAAQWPVIESIADYMNERPPELVRGYVEAPTGSGKTVLFTRLLEEQRRQGIAKPTLIVTYTTQLVDQTVEKLVDHGYQGTVDRVIGWRPDNGENDVLVTTYAGFVKNILGPHGRAIDNERINRGQIIFDEAHHLQGESTRKAAALLGNAAFLGFTATPDYDEKRILSNILPDEIHRITPAEGVQEGLIAPYRVVVLETGADMRDVSVTGGEYQVHALEKALNLNWRNTQIAKFYTEHFDGHRALFNASTVQHAMDMNLALMELGVPVATVHGGMTSRELKATLRDFKEGKIKVITQAKIISEGYDDPALSLVFNISPTLSRVKAMQRARAGRLDPANPHKVMLVVECLDEGYRAAPRLYGDPEVAGAWECTTNDQQVMDADRLIRPLVSFDATRVVVNKDDIQSEFGSREVRKQRRAWRRSIPVMSFDPKDPACVDYPPEVFFVTRGNNGAMAKSICAGCVDLDTCIDYSVNSGVGSGIWGGANYKKRRELRKIIKTQGQDAYLEAKATHIESIQS